MSAGRMIHAEYQGRSHEIPEVWLMGFCTARGSDDSPRTMADAVTWWDYQQQLAEMEASHSQREPEHDGAHDPR